MLKSCWTRYAQITAGMFLIGGLFGLAGRLCSGEWMPLAGREWSPLVSGLLVGLIIVYGAGYNALGAAVKAGKRDSHIGERASGRPVWLAMLVYFLSTWNGGRADPVVVSSDGRARRVDRSRRGSRRLRRATPSSLPRGMPSRAWGQPTEITRGHGALAPFENRCAGNSTGGPESLLLRFSSRGHGPFLACFMGGSDQDRRGRALRGCRRASPAAPRAGRPGRRRRQRVAAFAVAGSGAEAATWWPMVASSAARSIGLLA